MGNKLEHSKTKDLSDDAIRALIEQDKEYITKFNSGGYTLLGDAIHGDNFRAVKMLIEEFEASTERVYSKQAWLNGAGGALGMWEWDRREMAKDDGDRSALMLALELVAIDFHKETQEQIIKYLLERKVDTAWKDQYGVSAHDLGLEKYQ